MSIIGLAFCTTPVFAAQKFNERLYCKATSTSVRIYLFEEKDTFKCKQYLEAINNNLREEYNSLLQVMTMLNRGEDYAYWKDLFEKKKHKFLNLFGLLKKIENSIQEFQLDFLKKSQNFIASSLEEHLKQLTNKKEDLMNQLALQYDLLVEKKLLQTNLLIQTINVLKDTQDIDSFLQALDRYLSSAKK